MTPSSLPLKNPLALLILFICSRLCLIHPPLWVRLNMFVLSFGFTFGCSKYSLWKKLDFTERLEFLEHYVSKEVIRSLPEEVKMYDCELDEMM